MDRPEWSTYSQSPNITVPLESFATKLKPIVRDERTRGPKSSDNNFPYKSLGIHISEGLSFNPLGEVISINR